MEWTIKIVIPEHKTYDGLTVERQEKEVVIPFSCCDTVYYVHRKKWWKRNSKWVVTKSEIRGVWATNTVGVILSDNTHLSKDEFCWLFKNVEEAIDCCIEENEYRKVKIYGE